jgi:hypothetical protein
MTQLPNCLFSIPRVCVKVFTDVRRLSLFGFVPFKARRMQGRRATSRAGFHFAAVLACGALLCAGCGAELYEQRLENTRRLFQHMELLDSNLTGEWSDGTIGVRIRPPVQFQFVPPPRQPKRTAAENGDDSVIEPMSIDPRQPPYLNVELPGLRSAFVADLGAVQDGRSVKAASYMYVLTNHVIGDKGPGESGARFGDYVATLLGDALHVNVRPEDWQNVTVPARNDAFVTPLNYRLLLLNPPDPLLPVTEGHDRLTAQVALYVYKQGEVQVVVLFVFPRDYGSDEQLDKRVPLSLETLIVEGDSAARQPAPARSAEGAPASGTGAPPPKTGTSF